MSIAQFSPAEAGIAHSADSGGGNSKKAPPRRVMKAVADQKQAPEPR